MPQLDYISFQHQYLVIIFIFLMFVFFIGYVLPQVYLILKLRIKRLNKIIENSRRDVNRSNRRTKKLANLSIKRFVEVLTEYKEFNSAYNKLNLIENLINSTIQINNDLLIKTYLKLNLVLINITTKND